MSRPALKRSDLSPLWAARSIAILGASDRAGSLGRLPVSYLKRFGYMGKILPINPTADAVDGIRAYPSLVEAPGPIDLALLMVSASRVPDAIDECGAAGVPIAIVGASGFAEAGDEGACLEQEVVARAASARVRVLGPNCIGAVGFDSRLIATFTPMFSVEGVPLQSGNLAFVSQSGALGFGAVSLALDRGLGLGWVVNTGNEADISTAEVLEALIEQPACHALLAYVEQLVDGRALQRVAGAGKPIALVKSGTSQTGAAAAASHTGALATPDRVVEAVLRQLGIARAVDVDELLDFGDAFAQPRRPAGRSVAVVSTSGGSGILAADAIDGCELELAQLSERTTSTLNQIVPAFGSSANPIDVTATVMSDITLFERCLQAVADDPAVHTIVACFCVLTRDDVDAIVDALAAVAERTQKPVLVARTGADFLAPSARRALRAAGLPSYETPTRAVGAASALWTVSAPRPTLAGPDPSRGIDRPSPTVDEHELKLLLASVELPVVTGRLVESESEAEAAVAVLGGTAVCKAIVPALLHKTDVGAIELGITVADAAAAYRRLSRFGGRVRVEEMIDAQSEMLIGATSTPLGTIVSVGAGGIFAEALDDVAVRLAPVDENVAREMIAETRAGLVLTGARSRAPGDVGALARLVTDVSQLVASWPAPFELDLNPVAVRAKSVLILDAAFKVPAEGSSA